MEAVLTYLLDNAPQVAFLLVAVTVTWIISWKISEYRAELRETRNKVSTLPCDSHGDVLKETCAELKETRKKTEETENKVNALPCGSHEDMLKETGADLKSLNRIVTSTNEIVTEISRWIMKKDNEMIDSLAQKQSPLKMTPYGEVLFRESTAKDAIENNIDYLICEMEKQEPKNPYDVEDTALTTLIRNTGHDMFSSIKNYLYYSPESVVIKKPNNPEESKEIRISMQAIMQLMSIYLRDRYLEKHTELK